MDLQAHLNLYGIRQLAGWNSYYDRLRSAPESKRRKLARLRKPLVHGYATKGNLSSFYEFIADPEISGVVHSMKADAIRASGQFVTERLTGPRVLDVGCNIGYLTGWYGRVHSNIHVTGIDTSPSSIAEASRLATDLGLTNIDFQVADGGEYKPADTFDQVVDTQGLLGSAESGRLISTMLQWLNPGGKLLCVPPFIAAERCRPFLSDIEQVGGVLVEVGYVEHVDLGMPGAYLTVVVACDRGAVRSASPARQGGISMKKDPAGCLGTCTLCGRQQNIDHRASPSITDKVLAPKGAQASAEGDSNSNRDDIPF